MRSGRIACIEFSVRPPRKVLPGFEFFVFEGLHGAGWQLIHSPNLNRFLEVRVRIQAGVYVETDGFRTPAAESLHGLVDHYNFVVQHISGGALNWNEALFREISCRQLDQRMSNLNCVAGRRQKNS
jgi:hypothetical protein